MQENTYDDNAFFEKYSQMPRSVHGLEAAGEWHALQPLLPPLEGKRVLDLGCGFGWHCRYAVDHGAASVVGVDLSEKMLAEARAGTFSPKIRYVRSSIETFAYEPEAYDLVLSSLALHYVFPFAEICRKVRRSLADGGRFVFSVEHPVFTAQGPQAWHCGEDGTPLHWPVDDYFGQGPREAVFLGETVRKYHRTLTGYVTALLDAGFRLTALVEPEPDPALLVTVPGMRDELRRPMMLILAGDV